MAYLKHSWGKIRIWCCSWNAIFTGHTRFVLVDFAWRLFRYASIFFQATFCEKTIRFSVIIRIASWWIASRTASSMSSTDNPFFRPSYSTRSLILWYNFLFVIATWTGLHIIRFCYNIQWTRPKLKNITVPYKVKIVLPWSRENQDFQLPHRLLKHTNESPFLESSERKQSLEELWICIHKAFFRLEPPETGLAGVGWLCLANIPKYTPPKQDMFCVVDGFW